MMRNPRTSVSGSDRCDERRDQRIEDGDDEGDDDGAEKRLDRDVRHDPGRDEERGGCHEPGHEEPERFDLRADKPLLRGRVSCVQGAPLVAMASCSRILTA
jgi:hypothetical protein